MKKVSVFVVLAAITFVAGAQQASMLMGARVMGMADASACMISEWALFNNIAGTAETDYASVAFSYDACPSTPWFNRMAATISIPVATGAASSGVFRFGDDLYNEQVLSIGFANTMGLASLGLKLSYIQYHAEGLGNTRAITASFGGIARLTPELSIGAHIININQPKIDPSTGERLPTSLVVGLGVKPSSALFVAVDAEKDLDYPVVVRAGMEYRIHDRVFARTGFNLGVRAGYGGLGFKIGKFGLDYAFRYSLSFGPNHQASVSYRFTK